MLLKGDLYGLKEDTIHDLWDIFQSISEIEEVIVFGSRAKGNYMQGSDIDLAVNGEGVTFNTTLKLMSRIEDLGLLYKIDIQNYRTISNADMIAHIQRVGKVFWKRGFFEKHPAAI